MISFRASALPVLGFLVVLAGCGGATSTANGPDSTESTTQAANVAQTTAPTQGQHFHGGPGQEFLLRAALHEQSLNLTDAQKTTIENAMTASEPKGPPPDMKAHMATLAASVRANKFDNVQSFAPDQTALNAHIAASAKALDTLHATLTPAQRQALVDAVSKKGGEHRHEMGERGPGGDHMKEGRGPMGGLLIGLNVTDAQQAEIDAKLDAQKPSDADRAQMKAQHEAFETQMKAKLATFASDNFDSTAFVTPPAGAAPLGHKDRMVEELSVISSVLDATQREKLATRLEQGPKMQAPANEQPAQPVQQ